MSRQAFGVTMALAVVVGTGEAGAAESPAADKELVVRLDCLGNMPGPRPGIASRAYHPLLSETREWLAGKDAQAALFAGLPGLTTRQLITLWDVLWFPTDPDPLAARPKDMDAIAPGFAARFNATALAALAAEKAPSRRRLLINMVKPQAHTLTEKQKADLQAAEGPKGQ